MLTHQDEQRIKKLLDDRIDPLEKKINRIENNTDKILKMFVDLKQEHILTKTKVNNHDKRLTKIEKKMNLKSPNSSSVFA